MAPKDTSSPARAGKSSRRASYSSVSATWVKSLTNDKDSSGKIIKNWGVAARCCGGTCRHYGARLPAGYQRQGALSETIGRQTGRVGSLFRVSRPVWEEMGFVHGYSVCGGAGCNYSGSRLLYKRDRDSRRTPRATSGGRGKPSRSRRYRLA